MKSAIKIAIVDDHQIVIDGLIALLKTAKNIDVVFTTTHPKKALEIVNDKKLDLLITDIMMPEMTGYELAIEARNIQPDLKILALSMNSEASLINDMINNANVSGYALKNINKGELIHAIEKIAEGGIYFSEEVIEELKNISTKQEKLAAAQLTDREIEIIQMIEKECNNKKIAELLFISERTVETHRKNIYRKTNTNSILGIVKYAYVSNLIKEKSKSIND